MENNLKELVEILQLPIYDYEKYDSEYTRPNTASDDIVYDLYNAIDIWENSGEPSKTLINFVDSLLKYSEFNTMTNIDGFRYFLIYKDLRKGSRRDWRGLDHKTAKYLLSRASFVYKLMHDEDMSASQVSRILASLERSLDIPYKAIQVLAKHFHIKPDITLEDLKSEIWPYDQELSSSLFADASLEDSYTICSEAAEKLIENNTLQSDLSILTENLTDSKTSSWPYLQILHWCCLPIELYDHPASYLYEFRPRGLAADDLFGRYNLATGNPVLNNAKASLRIDSYWAGNRSGEEAHALVRVLSLLDSIPYSARRGLARIIRAWLIRILELQINTKKPLLLENTRNNLWIFSEIIVNKETGTKGIIEQRIVDSLCEIIYSQTIWRSKGLGDSVNASNMSKNKLGDIEFINIDSRSAVAIEAHGGTLSKKYVDYHRKSLSRIVGKRLEDSWKDLDIPQNWHIEVIFVAHSLASDLPEEDILHDVSINYTYWTYDYLLTKARESGSPVVEDIFQTRFIDALNNHTVPQWVRDKALEIINKNR